MLSFENYNIVSFVNRRWGVLMDTINISDKDIKNIMETQQIRKTKSNIEKCKFEFIDEILKTFNSKNEWRIINEPNGNITLKR